MATETGLATAEAARHHEIAKHLSAIALAENAPTVMGQSETRHREGAMRYDLIVVGGGIAGSSLARRMAKNGARVLLLEQEPAFRDRIRGECLQPWGVGEARMLGVAEVLQDGANEMRCVDFFINGQHAGRRDFLATTPQASGMWGFYHPRAQEALLSAATAAGTAVRRGVTVRHVELGNKPRVEILQANERAEFEARFVAICAGRHPALRTELGFKPQHGSIPLML